MVLEFDPTDGERPTPDEQVKRAKFILRLGIGAIILIGTAVAVFFIFLQPAIAPTTNNLNSNTVNKNSNLPSNTDNSNLNTNSPVNSSAPAEKTLYQNDDIGVRFYYPTAWAPLEVVRENAIAEEGEMTKVNFNGVGRSSFGGDFQLLYSTDNFAPGREIWQAEVLATFDKDYGLQTLCQQGIEETWSWGNDIRFCTGELVGGRWTVEYYTRIDALGGEGTLHFAKIFAFQTGDEKFPVGVLALLIPDTLSLTYQGKNGNPGTEGLSAADQSALNGIYVSLKDRTTADDINSLLDEFDAVVGSVSFTP